ncbi:hypothetical protein [Sporosarcina psychrophila]|uniref:Uncharacterized protein n=1 Tax=Sporosarcina psychrophila TaxID=1476 RepID=A0ABV2KBK6_SPOPS
MRRELRTKLAQANIRIYFITWSKWDGSHSGFDENIPLGIGQIAISPRWGRTAGFFLDSIMGGRGATEFSLSVYHDEELVDITEWFFERYERMGRCIFWGHGTRTWLVGDKKRYTVINNTRRCDWCGTWQKREVVTKKTIERIETWT